MSDSTNAQFADSIKAVADAAVQTDLVFSGIRDNLDMLSKVPAGWPSAATQGHQQQLVVINGYITGWNALLQRWKQCLPASKNLADQTIEVLQRFNNDCLNTVNTIVNDQDRINANQKLQAFINDLDAKDQSSDLSRQIHELKRDIADFITKMDSWPPLDPGNASENALITNNATNHLVDDVTTLQGIIDSLNKNIKDANAAMIKSATLAGIYLRLDGVNVDYAQWQAIQDIRQVRSTKVTALREARGKLEGAMPNIVVELKFLIDGWQPQSDQMFDNLLALAEIWSSVRNRAVELNGYLKGALDADGRLRMKLEVGQAQTTYTPLQDGLTKYSAALGTYLQKAA